MPGKKAHKPKNIGNENVHGIHQQIAPGRKSAGQTSGQYERDPKRRQGQYAQAGTPPLIKK